MTPQFSDILFTALAAGVAGGMVMEAILWLIGRAGWARADMIVALGSLITKRREGAWGLGLAIHAVAAIGFAVAYTFLLVNIGYTAMPAAMMAGAGIGFVHGLIVSLGLVWVIADHHPLAEFNEADLAIGLAHLVGHVAYGAVVGFVIGISSL